MSENKVSKGAIKNRIEKLRSKINKAAGQNIAYNLTDGTAPTEVKDWIPTGSRWLDSIIVKGKMGGIPVSKITELAGLSGAGKSYMAMQIAKNAQEKGIDVVYFDSESAIDGKFCEKIGLDLEKLVYVQAVSMEQVLGFIETLLKENENPMLFILDSLAMTPSESDIDSDFNPNSNIAVKARITAKGLSKLIIPLANHGSTFLVVNQLKTNIDPSNPHAALSEPYVTPGGKALQYSYSLRLWLTGRKAKKWFIENNQGDRIGSDVRCKVEKSRFGSFGRECHFKILWADDENISILDEESWFEAIKPSKRLTSGGPWHTLKIGEKEWKFQGEEGFKKKIREDEEFKKAVLDTMDRVVIERNSDE